MASVLTGSTYQALSIGFYSEIVSLLQALTLKELHQRMKFSLINILLQKSKCL